METALDYFGEETLHDLVNYVYSIISAELIVKGLERYHRSESLDRWQRVVADILVLTTQALEGKGGVQK